MKIHIALALAFVAIATTASAQGVARPLQLSGEYAALGLYRESDQGVGLSGFGIRGDYRLTRRVDIEGRVLWFPTNALQEFEAPGREDNRARTRRPGEVPDVETRGVLRSAPARAAAFFKCDRRTSRPGCGERRRDAFCARLGNRCGNQGWRSAPAPSATHSVQMTAGLGWRFRFGLSLVAIPGTPRRRIGAEGFAGDIAERLKDPAARALVERAVACEVDQARHRTHPLFTIEHA